MAEWQDQSITVVNELDQLWVDLERDIRDDPSYEEIVGIPAATMLAHSTHAVQQYLARLDVDGQGVIAMLSPDSWVQLYSMGFTLGTRYGRSHPL